MLIKHDRSQKLTNLETFTLTETTFIQHLEDSWLRKTGTGIQRLQTTPTAGSLETRMLFMESSTFGAFLRLELLNSLKFTISLGFSAQITAQYVEPGDTQQDPCF